MNITTHQKWFREFFQSRVAACKKDSEPMQLKFEHTQKVLENSRKIAQEERFEPELARKCALAALYHDLARFDQYLSYGTFKDADSRNHGLWAVQLLKRFQRLKDENTDFARTVYSAVCLHNRAVLPKALTGEALTVTRVTRDADKLDILRVMSEHLCASKPYNPTVILSLPDDPQLAGQGVLQAAFEHRAALYGDLKSVNDFRILLATWFFDLNFRASKNAFIQNGHAVKLLADLPDGPHAKARDELLRSIRHDGPPN